MTGTKMIILCSLGGIVADKLMKTDLGSGISALAGGAVGYVITKDKPSSWQDIKDDLGIS